MRSGLLRRASLIALLLALSSYVLFRIAHWLIAADRGLDITDETMYLLSATSDATWGSPFGWHTKPLLQVCGGDIACFRSAGFVVLFAASLALTMSVYSVLRGFKKSVGPLTILYQSLLAFGATLLFYTGFLSRTPAYNWVNAIGILVAAAAHVRLLGQTPLSSFHRRWLLEGIAAAGIFFSAPGKPSSPFLLLFIFGVACTYVSTFRQSVLSIGRQLVATAFLLVASVAVGFWRGDFIALFKHALTAPTPAGANQTPLGAARAVLQVPLDAVERAWAYALDPRFGPLLVTLAAATWMRSRSPGRLTDAAFLGAFLPLVARAITAFARPERIYFGSGALYELSIALLLAFGVVRAVSYVAERRTLTERGPRTWWFHAVLLAYLLALPAIFSFGSSNGFKTMFGLFPLPVILVLAQLATVQDRFAQRAMQISLVTLVVLIGMFARSTAIDTPYRTASIASATEPVEILGSSLLVEPHLGGLIQAMQTDARSAGFEGGTGLVSLDWEWQSFTPLALGAQPPTTMVTTHNMLLERFRHNAKRFANPKFLENAWITVTPDRHIPEPAQPAVNAVILEFEALVRRSFPDAYRCIGDYGTTQLGRPRTAGEPQDTSCPLKGSFPYDLNGGFIRPD